MTVQDLPSTPVWWKRLLRFIIRIPALILIGVFRLWQLLASPTYGQTCRFYPTCSSYGVQAVRVHGALRGGWLAARRVARCHPWNPGGVDPVPPPKRMNDDHLYGDGAAHHNHDDCDGGAHHDEAVRRGESSDRLRSSVQ
jgi:putative membrane protein insertion efficiency factor